MFYWQDKMYFFWWCYMIYKRIIETKRIFRGSEYDPCSWRLHRSETQQLYLKSYIWKRWFRVDETASLPLTPQREAASSFCYGKIIHEIYFTFSWVKSHGTEHLWGVLRSFLWKFIWFCKYIPEYGWGLYWTLQIWTEIIVNITERYWNM